MKSLFGSFLIVAGLFFSCISSSHGDTPNDLQTESIKKIIIYELRTISSSLDAYAKSQNGKYPLKIEELIYFNPFVAKNNCNIEFGEYYIECNLSVDGYKITAKPIRNSALDSYEILTGGILSGKDASTYDGMYQSMQPSAKSSNDRLAQSTIKSYSYASEAFFKANGKYPTSMNELTETNPPYLYKESDHCAKEKSGFRYECALSANGYEFFSLPLEPGVSGSAKYTITTGMKFTEN